MLFAAESARLTSEARAQLDTLTAGLRNRSDLRLRIVGHCALLASEEGRRALSGNRAAAVADYLSGQGWAPGSPPILTGRGAMEPATRDPALQHLNRRAVSSTAP